MTASNGKVDVLGGDVSNAAEETISLDRPYVVDVTIRGTAPILFHRYQDASVEAKSKAAKGSKAKKTDDIESYVWRDADGNLALPGEYLRGSMVEPRNGAAKYRQDPRSPRKSALDLFKAGIVATTDLGTLHNADGEIAANWDYLDRRRVVVQRSAVTRERPALLAGWSATITFAVFTPVYITPDLLHDVLIDAGRLVGVGDFRPTFGRFQITKFDVGMLD